MNKTMNLHTTGANKLEVTMRMLSTGTPIIVMEVDGMEITLFGIEPVDFKNKVKWACEDFVRKGGK